MKDYNNFKSWKSPHSTLMQDLSFSASDDIFIYTNFKMKSPFDMEESQVLFAENFEEAAGYFRHIFLYDLLVDATDDLELEGGLSNEKRQKDAILILNFWFKTGKAFTCENPKQEVLKICNEFNNYFSNNQKMQYEFRILNGADELNDFLKIRYKNHPNFDCKKLENICSKKLFVGDSLKDFISRLFIKQ